MQLAGEKARNYDNRLIVLRSARGNSLNGNHVSQFTVVLLNKKTAIFNSRKVKVTLVALFVLLDPLMNTQTFIH